MRSQADRYISFNDMFKQKILSLQMIFMLQFPLESGMKTEMLENFVKSHQEFQNTALRVDMSTILKNETSLFAFMNFLKEKQAIDQLHFCLAVGEFFICKRLKCIFAIIRFRGIQQENYES